MSCPNNVTPNSFLMDSLAGTCRGENYSSNQGMYMQSANDFSCGMMRNCGIIPALSKRDEVNHAGGLSLNTYPPYLSQLDAWCDPKNTYRIEQPVARQLPSCSFPTSSSWPDVDAPACLAALWFAWGQQQLGLTGRKGRRRGLVTLAKLILVSRAEGSQRGRGAERASSEGRGSGWSRSRCNFFKRARWISSRPLLCSPSPPPPPPPALKSRH
uniref:Uncharacterized protein n=1 Tax=Naja naja TaxID=35670 RepID=A0A8C6XHS4_NAJNA